MNGRAISRREDSGKHGDVGTGSDDTAKGECMRFGPDMDAIQRQLQPDCPTADGGNMRRLSLQCSSDLYSVVSTLDQQVLEQELDSQRCPFLAHSTGDEHGVCSFSQPSMNVDAMEVHRKGIESSLVRMCISPGDMSSIREDLKPEFRGHFGRGRGAYVVGTRGFRDIMRFAGIIGWCESCASQFSTRRPSKVDYHE